MDIRRMDLERFIGAYCTEFEDAGGKRIHRGRTFEDGISVSLRVPDGFREVEEWSVGTYRRVWKSDTDIATIAYCEGDITVVRHDTRESCEADLERARRFYEKY